MPTDDAWQAFQRQKERASSKPKKTVTGRVVYNRKLHAFTLRDWARIGRKVPPPETFDQALQTVGIAFGLVRDLASYLFGWMPQYRLSQLIFNEVKPIVEQALTTMISFLPSDNPKVEKIFKLLDLLGAI